MDKYLGKTLDNRYEILEKIGEGGMSVVYRASDNRLNRFVALKVLKDEYMTDNSLRQQFHNESQSVAVLSHPNIVPVYDVSFFDNSEYIVMELIDGITLKDYLERRGALTWKETTFFAIQIAKALEHAHGRNIIHRDIKPQNIMLLRDGTLKVTDFGIARNMSKLGTKGISEAMGSVHYVSPEQATGSAIDARADLYSFGVVMYEMLTGRLPFEGENPIAIAIQHMQSMAVPPSAFVSTIPKTLETITMKAMSPRLDRRYASASDILHDLESFRNDPHFVLPPDISQTDVTEERQKIAKEKPYTPPSDTATKPRIFIKTNPTPVKEEDKPEKKGGIMAKYKKNQLFGGTFSKAVLFVFFGGILLLLGGIMFIAMVLNPVGSSDSSRIEVPYLIGKYYDDVAASNEFFEYNVEAGEYVFNDKYEYGLIIDQDPSPQKMMKKGGKITVTISRGRKAFKLPDYSGKDSIEVDSELSEKGIFTVLEGIHSKTVSEGLVIKTDPEAGTEVNQYIEKITIYYSLGPEALKKVQIPELYGYTEVEATEKLISLGLKPGLPTFIDSAEPSGTVVYQSIEAGTVAEEGTIVNYQISNGALANEDGTLSGFGISIDPYEDDEKKRTMDFTLTFIETKGPIKVEVKVNDKTEYTGTHYFSEGSVSIPLTAPEGKSKIVVTQNNKITYNQTVNFE